MFTCCRRSVGPPPEKNDSQEYRRSHIRSFCKVFKVSNLPELCLFIAVSEEKVPIYFFLLNVFEHKTEVIMSWQICREVLNACLDPAYQIENKFWNLKAGSLQVGITNEKLEKVICSRGVEAFLIKGFCEQTMLSLHKKIQSNWKGYANMRVPVKVLRLLPWEKTSIVILQIPS